jgi:hypothetical protein
MNSAALTLLLVLVSGPAFATPMLDLCRPIAPKTCVLTDKSTYDDFIGCFAPVTLDETDPAQLKCAPELLHAKVHIACDPKDIPAVCAAVKPGADRVMTCLRQNRKKLTAPCLKALDDYDGWYKSHAPKKRRSGAVSAVRC